ncbi:MAG: MurR/RpiR family transcriptional regulator [Erysipelotrichaceae bacterium]|nr:MurR/RpiR family transcriptional regulator [Erysipelotrichaceae bacterium]
MGMSIDNQIKTIFPYLTKTEKRIAYYLSDNLKTMEHLSLESLSKSVGAGEASIVRFVRKLGYDSWNAFKDAVIRELHATEEEETEPEGDIFDRLEYEAISMIKETHSANSESLLQSVVEEIRKATRVYFYGMGTSGIVATMAAHRFFRMGLEAHAVTDAHMMEMTAELAKKTDLFVAVSFSGAVVEVIRGIERAKEKNAKIVVITSFKLSPLATMADYIITIPPRSLEILRGAGAENVIPQMFILEELYLYYRQNNKEAYSSEERVALSVSGHQTQTR